nr:putative acyltransferase 10 [Crocosmia x crocosmiiflora]
MRMVGITETSVVVPVEETPKHRIWISNLDLNVIRSHVATIYVYKATDDDDNFLSVEAVKAALAKALVPFYPLAGRLSADRDGRPEIDCTGEGVQFVVARSDCSLDEFGDFRPSPEMRQKLVPSAESADPPCILLMLQLTFFKCGGVTLGIAIHHTAIDGQSAFHFINHWADLTKGITELAIAPFFDRTLLRARFPPNADLFLEDNPKSTPTSAPTSAKSTCVSATFKLSDDQVSLLNHRSKQLSPFRAIVGHVWRSVCIARGLTPDQVTRVYLIAEVRDRLKPPLPEGYFGNAVCRVTAVATSGEVISNPISFGAQRLKCAIGRVTDEYVRSAIDYIELEKNEGKLNSNSLWGKTTEADLCANSWLTLPTLGADFGWGKPAFMGRGIMSRDGLVYLLYDIDGRVSVTISLEEETMESFKKVFYEELNEA